MTATDEFIVNTDDFVPNGAGWADDGDTLTFVECAAPDCHNIAFTAVPGSGQRSSKYCRQPDCTRKTAADRQRKADDDPFNSPLTTAEKRLAKQLALPLRLAGMGIYRANVIDGLIVGHRADELANALVLEGRVSKPVRQMCEAVAKFAGAGPIALVLIDMGLEIANNHKVPLLGDIKPVGADVRLEAQRIEEMRSKRKSAERSIAEEVHQAAAPVSRTVVCPTCGRTVLKQPGQPATLCMCGATIG